MNRFNFSAKSLEEAITKACVELGVPSDGLDYTVVEQGSAGILGIGARPWIISACRLEEVQAEEEQVRKEAEKKKLEAAAAERKAEDSRKKEEERKTEDRKTAAPERKEALKKEKAPAAVQEFSVKSAAEPRENREITAGNVITGQEAEQKAIAFLTAVFDSIDMKVEIRTSYDEMLNELSVDLNGEDMGVLIGKRGQTLDSLQYLTGQVINKHGSGYIRVKLDTENYRERRVETLETLAHNMAHKVRRTRRPMALEPMNPYERRIIHSTLQDDKDVFTRSEGEEPYRHVVICYVKHKR